MFVVNGYSQMYVNCITIITRHHSLGLVSRLELEFLITSLVKTLYFCACSVNILAGVVACVTEGVMS